MPAVKVDIAPTILDWVMSTIILDELDDEYQNRLYKWKNGEKSPTFGQIESLSKATHIPLGYFFLKTPPKEEYKVLNYRTLGSTAKENCSRDLIDTISNMSAVQEWMRNFMISTGEERLSFVGSKDSRSGIENIATAIRKTIGLTKAWQTAMTNDDAFKHLRQLLSDSGILVMMNGVVGLNNSRALDAEEFRAFTLIDDYAPLIFINRNDTRNGRMFSLLHETVHVWLGVDDLYNDNTYFNEEVSPTEQLCNAVAAELLVPRDVFIEKWEKAIKKASTKRGVIQQLARLFSCSTTVIARKAMDCKYITQDQYSTVAEEAVNAATYIKVKTSGGDFYNTNASRWDHGFIIALNNSINEGKTLSTDAYKMTGTTRKTFPGLVKQIQGTGNE